MLWWAVLLVALAAFAFLGALPMWRHSRRWGWSPGGILGALLLLLVFVTVLVGAA